VVPGQVQLMDGLVVRDPVPQPAMCVHEVVHIGAALRLESGKRVPQRVGPEAVLVVPTQEEPPEAEGQLGDDPPRCL
jgi:hypothetical protein